MYEAKKTTEKQVHVCIVCNKGFLNRSEHMTICPTCYRKHNIDLAFWEFLGQHTDEIEHALKNGVELMFGEVDSKAEEFTRKAKKNRRYGWMFLILQLDVIVYAVIPVVLFLTF